MGKGYVICLAVFAATGSLLFGYDSGVMTNVIASPHFLNYFDTYPESDIVGALNSTFSGGAAIGALMAGSASDIIGRKYTIQFGALIATVGAILQSAAVNLPMLLVGRITSGWAIGALSMVIPVYQAECAPPASRGLIVGIAQQMIGVGWVISSFTGYACGYAHGPFEWRFPLALQGAPSVILMFGMIIFPESPRHLIKKQRYEEGIAQEFQEAKEAFEAETSLGMNSWRAMFVVPQWRKRLAIAVALHTFGQSTGINAINYYQTIMYRSLGIKGHNITLLAACYTLVGPVANLYFIIYLSDRVGRRKPLLFGGAAITLCLIGEAIFQGVNPGGERKAWSGLGILCIWLVSGCFSLSYGPVCWVFISEILPMQIRGGGVAVATGLGHWGVNVMWSQVSPKGMDKIGWKFYLVFVAFNICITLPCMYFFFPETKGIPLEEMDQVFGGSPDLSKWRDPNAPPIDKVALEHVEAKNEYGLDSHV
ncbi:Mitogen-activated protein kinase [Ascosphaera pollenicola]|nr:Mitogen-activated protein kinase [Ascosphaera pollenicola]